MGKKLNRTLSIILIMMMVLSYGSSVSFMAGSNTAYAETDSGAVEAAGPEEIDGDISDESGDAEAIAGNDEAGGADSSADSAESADDTKSSEAAADPGQVDPADEQAESGTASEIESVPESEADAEIPVPKNRSVVVFNHGAGRQLLFYSSISEPARLVIGILYGV